MSLRIYTSNRMEKLVDCLASVLAEPLSSPFLTEMIVLQSKGMQRWLSMELAARLGVWANCSYPFPNALVNRFFKNFFPDNCSVELFSPEVMRWRLFELLPELSANELFVPLHRYLENDIDDLKRFQLSTRIADLFDQYSIYRSDMLLRWEEQGGGNEEDELWQSQLWKSLYERHAGVHRGELKEKFCSNILSMQGAESVPERISLFGVSYLPAYHLEIIAAISRITDVHLFFLSPTREYWADIVSSSLLARLSPEERERRFEGNPLLASLGKLGREFSELAVELGTVAVKELDLYAEPEGKSLLCRIQSDILNLTGAEEGRVRQIIAEDDHSIQIHSCHSPLREVEVLYDNLLAMFEADPALEPRDIIVITPDIELYAPYITAVFEGQQNPSKHIPYSIADHAAATEGEVAKAILQLIGLPGSRLTVLQLLELISIPSVMRRFDISEGDLPLIHDWLEKTNIRWGLDESDRKRLGLPPYRSNSWRAGLERLLLGYAIAGSEEQLYDGILPYNDMEGASVSLLGNLIDFIDRIEQFCSRIDTPRSLAAWSDDLLATLEQFVLMDDDSSQEFLTVSTAFSELAELQRLSGFSGDLTLAVIRSLLSTRLKTMEPGAGFITGGVTFCAMLYMSSIPFKVICMIGMNDGAFPRRNIASGFDLIASHPRPGDRSLRDEDRYLFLETVLSARSSLYISFTGQSIRDNSEIPPSVLVSELFDIIGRGFQFEGGKKPEERLVTIHRLQAFSRHYFTGDASLFSFSEENFKAVSERYDGTGIKTEFMPENMPEPDELWREISITRLLRFVVNPAKFFIENRLGIRLTGIAEPLEEREPFGMNALEAYSLKDDVVKHVLKGGKGDDLFPKVRSMSGLPPAVHGELLFKNIAVEATLFARKVEIEINESEPLPDMDCELFIDGFRLYGTIKQIYPSMLCRYRCSRLKAADQLKAWVEHLIMNAVAREGYPMRTRLVMSDRTVTFSKLDKPMEILAQLIELYWQGLARPLPFFPASSMACAAAKGGWDIRKAYAKWEDSFIPGIGAIPGEAKDPYFNLCFGKKDPFDEQFEHISRALLEPMLLNMSLS